LDYHVRTRQVENARVGCKIAIDFRKPFRVFESLNRFVNLYGGLFKNQPYKFTKNCFDIAILAGVVNFLPHPNTPQGIGEGVRNSQMI
jgi:hypothetical protein